ncbi:MAG: glycoside hydrolase family 3 C-terminal domain-containing protein [Elusimicrobiota bacterium]
MKNTGFLTMVLAFTFVLSTAQAKTEKLNVAGITASSLENGKQEMAAENAIDGNVSTRWASEWADPQWIACDLGAEKEFNLVKILWESAFAENYDIQVSNNQADWNTVYSKTGGSGSQDICPLGKQKARYVRILGKKRGTQWGYSILELEVDNYVSGAFSPPEKVESLTGNKVMVIRWSPKKENEDIYAYNIYRCENPIKTDNNYKKINETPVDKNEYCDRDIKDKTAYSYLVKSIDYAGKESKNSGEMTIVTAFISEKGTYLDASLDVEQRVNDLVSRMSLEEKIEQLGGTLKGREGYDDMSNPRNNRLGIPPIKCTDGPWGVRWGDATAFPVSIAVAASWDIKLAEKVGAGIGSEVRAKGRNTSLGPCFNIARDPRGGRVHEGFGEDPYLASEIAVATIKGVQSRKVIATAKHFACNNKEDGRFGGPVVIDEITLREIYLPAFEAAVKKGGAWSIMSAHNKVNATYCAENKHLLRDILKDEWGFKGFVMCDWGGCYSAANSANYGLDLEMPYGIYYGKPLEEAVRGGAVKEEVIDDMVRRMLRPRFWAGLFEEEAKEDPSVFTSREHKELALEAARESIVLLKNEGNLLPIDKNKVKKIAVIGPGAKLGCAGEDLGSGQVYPLYAVTPLDGIKNKAAGIEITDSVKDADLVIYVGGLTKAIGGRQEGEGMDRTDLRLPGGQDQQISAALKENKKLVIVLVGGSAVLMDWIDSVPAVVQAWYCGQEGGNAIADVLFGDYSPGGKLPLTFPKSMEQLRAYDWNYTNEYKTGVGYPYYEKMKLAPLFPFGHGLSYTKFKYGKMSVTPAESASGNIDISVEIENNGSRAGDEVVQLYIKDEISARERPVKALRGFKRITLKPGEKSSVTFKLNAKDLAYYRDDMKLIVEPGVFKAMIGSSSADIRCEKTFKISKEILDPK